MTGQFPLLCFCVEKGVVKIFAVFWRINGDINLWILLGKLVQNFYRRCLNGVIRIQAK